LLDSGVAHKTLAAFETYLLHGAALSGLSPSPCSSGPGSISPGRGGG
jgi:hypothetical protein